MLKQLKYSLSVFGILIALQTSAQITIAEDWTQTDCAGVDHNLFATLDTGSVVVMEIVMLDGCMPCINTAHLIGPVIDAYNSTNANRIHYYTFGYNDTYNCDALSDWKIENEITCHAQFVEGAAIADYYGGMGMPTIVVVGRNSHHVYFNQFGFVPADTIDFALALEYALGLAEPVSIEASTVETISCFPNPANAMLQFNGLPNQCTIAVYDLVGNCVIQTAVTNGTLDITRLTPGLYNGIITSASGITALRFVKS